MKVLCLGALLAVLLSGCQTTLTLTNFSRDKDYAKASRGCSRGENAIELRSGQTVKAGSVQFAADSVRWTLHDTLQGAVPLSSVSCVRNTDYARGAKEGRQIGCATGFLAGGFTASMAMGRVDFHEATPWIMMALTSLVIGPVVGGAEGADRGSHLTVVIDSTLRAP